MKNTRNVNEAYPFNANVFVAVFAVVDNESGEIVTQLDDNDEEMPALDIAWYRDINDVKRLFEKEVDNWTASGYSYGSFANIQFRVEPMNFIDDKYVPESITNVIATSKEPNPRIGDLNFEFFISESTYDAKMAELKKDDDIKFIYGTEYDIELIN